MQNQLQPTIADAVRILGGVTATAQKIVAAGRAPNGSMTAQNVQNWVSRGYCPPRYAAWFEAETGIFREYLISENLVALLDGICDEVAND